MEMRVGQPVVFQTSTGPTWGLDAVSAFKFNASGQEDNLQTSHANAKEGPTEGPKTKKTASLGRYHL